MRGARKKHKNLKYIKIPQSLFSNINNKAFNKYRAQNPAGMKV
jgi:hypothetical protein